jgi:tetratricopeptide (TPR) repeat protein
MSIGAACELPGLDRELSRLIALYERMVVEGRGQVVFVAGDDGSGRNALVRYLAAELSRSRSRAMVLAGGFQDATYVAWDQAKPSPRVKVLLDRALSAGESAAGLAGNFLPLVGLFGQAVSASKAVLELAEGMIGEHGRPDLSVLMPRVLRRLCEDGPVVCVVDDADRAPGGWWSDLVLLFARRIARDLPLLLVLGVDGPQQLGAHEDDEPDALFVARTLTGGGLAQWHPMTALTAEDLSQWTGPATPNVLRVLLEVTGGRADWIAQLWGDWQRRLVVDQTPDDLRWQFTDGYERAVDEVEDLLEERLRNLIDASDLNALEGARRLLCCGALEGREFTAEAVAVALGRDRDEIIDRIDESLVKDDAHTDGLVVETNSVLVNDETGKRTLWRYRFAAELDWWTLRHHGLSDGEQRDLSLRLAHAMSTLYSKEAHRFAPTLARLYKVSGDVDKARYYRHMSEIQVGREVVLWRAGNTLSSADPEGCFERRRATQILLAAAVELFHVGPFNDGLEFALAAHRLADQTRDQALALYYSGVAWSHLGDFPPAGRDLGRALELQGELGDRLGEANTRHALANIDYKHGEYEKARTEYLTVLELRRELGDRQGEAYARHGLASIDYKHGEYEKARIEFLAVLELRRELGDRHGEANTLHELANINFVQSKYEKARIEFLAVLELRRELGDRHGEAYARHELASIDYKRGEHEKARIEYLAVIELQRELGDRRGEAATLAAIANVNEAAQGRVGQ